MHLRPQFRLSFVSMFVFGFVLLNGNVALATTRWVNDPPNSYSPPGTSCTNPGYSTIGAAVTAASAGDTIMVCAGFYPELVTVDQTLTFLGPQQDVDARTRAVPVTSEAVVGAPDGAFQIEANNVVINGFTIEGVVSNPSAPPFTGLGAGVWTNPGFSGTQGGHQILNNIIQLNIVGIYLNNRCAFGTVVRFNLIRNNTVPGPASGNGIYSDLELCNAVIDRNKFSGNTSGSVLVIGFPVSASNVSVTNNELVAGSAESISFLGVSNSVISSNVSTGSTNAATIDLFGGNSQVTVNSNTLFNGNRAIVVDNPFSGFGVSPNSDITAHQNCIQGNSIAGMEVDPLAYPITPQLNAENNWWGSASGPNEVPRHPSGMGDKIIDPDQNVDFDPWLKSCGAPTTVTGGGQVPVNLTGGKGSFGFNAKQDTQSGHLNYINHVTGAHLDCTVTAVTILTPTSAQLSGPCQSSTALSFMARVEDNGEPGKNTDKFFITYGTVVNEGGTLISGNIQIHK